MKRWPAITVLVAAAALATVWLASGAASKAAAAAQFTQDNPCAAKPLNPRAAKPTNPCAAKPTNPCAANPANPCAAKRADPRSAKPGPRKGKATNPSVTSPCAAKNPWAERPQR